jgi:hypothetical protein
VTTLGPDGRAKLVAGAKITEHLDPRPAFLVTVTFGLGSARYEAV